MCLPIITWKSTSYWLISLFQLSICLLVKTRKSTSYWLISLFQLSICLLVKTWKSTSYWLISLFQLSICLLVKTWKSTSYWLISLFQLSTCLPVNTHSTHWLEVRFNCLLEQLTLTLHALTRNHKGIVNEYGADRFFHTNEHIMMHKYVLFLKQIQ